MAERIDPLDQLHRPLTPIAPRPEFAASLRRRMLEELAMTITQRQEQGQRRKGDHGALGMVHLRVGDADRAMRFFGALFDWEGERVEMDDHISHYVSNTTVTVRI